MYLERVPKGEGDIVCLNCGQNFDLNYDGYLPWSCEEECLNCGKTMEIEADVQINFYVTMKVGDLK